MSEPRRFDVAVVGGGPAGLAAALGAARAGARTLLVEREQRARRERHAGARPHDLRPLPGRREQARARPRRASRADRGGARARRRRGRTRRGGPRLLSADPPGRVRRARARALRAHARAGARARGARWSGCGSRSARATRLCSNSSAPRVARKRARRRGGRERRRDRRRARRRRQRGDAAGAPPALLVHRAPRGRRGRRPRALRAPPADRQPSRARRAGASSPPSACRWWCAPTAGAARSSSRSRCRRSRAVPSRRSTRTTSRRSARARVGSPSGSSSSCARAREGFAAARVADWPARVGIRETRRVLGRVVLEREDVLEGRRRDDEVALSSWPIELWEDHRRARYEHPAAPCSVPLGALVSRSHPRLGVAGRCLSASHEAHGALRVIGTALATGEAIGVAAALAAHAGAGARRRRPRTRARTHPRRRGEAAPVSALLDAIRAHARERPAAEALVADGPRGHAARLVRGARPAHGRGRGAPRRCRRAPRASAAGSSRARAPASSRRRSRSSPRAPAWCRSRATTRAPRSSASPSRPRCTTWSARRATTMVCRARGAVSRGGRRRRRRVPRARAGLPALHLGHHERAQGRDPLAPPHRRAARRRERGAPHRPRGPHPLAPADGAPLRGVDPALPALRRDHPAALRLAHAARARAGGARARDASSTPRRSTITCSRRTPRASGSPTCASPVSTAEGLRAEVAERFRERFGIPLAQALGIIEVGLPVMNLAEAEKKPTALGRPLPAYDVWLRAEDGSRVTGPGGPSLTGEVCIRGPGLFDAYLAPWTPAAALVEPDGFRTGDQGWFDADGTLFLAGRRHNRISMAGMKFFAEEVEDVLVEAPGGARVPRARAPAPAARRDPGRRGRAGRSRARAEAQASCSRTAASSSPSTRSRASSASSRRSSAPSRGR